MQLPNDCPSSIVQFIIAAVAQTAQAEPAK